MLTATCAAAVWVVAIKRPIQTIAKLSRLNSFISLPLIFKIT